MDTMVPSASLQGRIRPDALSARGFRFLLVVFFHATIVLRLGAQSVGLDPAFEKIPLDRWLSERDSAHFRWSVKVWPAVLSFHQRLRTRVSLQIDGRDVMERRGRGEILMLAQYSARGGGVYQNHHAIDLQNSDEEVKSAYMIWDLDAFVLPGEYRIAFAICDTTTGEHSTMQRTLHVAQPRGDPLPGAWRGIPQVEFLEAKEPPEGWYLPSLAGHLSLSLETKHPVYVDLLLNLTPSELARGSQARTSNQNLGVLIPLLKVIAQVRLLNGSLNAALLDLMRQRTSFDQRDIHDLDWERLKTALVEANPNVVDARSLANRRQIAQFFVREVGNRIAEANRPKDTSAPLRVLIVLSAPMGFNQGADLHPIEETANPNLRVYYVRCHSLMQRPVMRPPSGRGGAGRGGSGRGGSGRATMPGPGRRSSGPPNQTDDLVRTIKPLKPRVFEIRTPSDFRSALGAILTELSRM